MYKIELDSQCCYIITDLHCTSAGTLDERIATMTEFRHMRDLLLRLAQGLSNLASHTAAQQRARLGGLVG